VINSVRNLAPAQRKAVLEEGAKKEGQLAWYTSMSLTDFPKGRGGFRKIRSGCEGQCLPAGAISIMNKIDTEARAGRYAVDIVTASPGRDVGAKTEKLLDVVSSPLSSRLFPAVPTIHKASGRPSK
jgi:hypothetical protein